MVTSKFFVVFALLFLLRNNGIEASHQIYPEYQNLKVAKVSQTHRTGYHFQPPRNWINAPMYYKGLYHFFYQYNPKGAVWGNIVWAHSVSKDLINWKSLEPAISPSKWFDEKGCWSGSATILKDNGPIILYTGVDSKEREYQDYAVPKNLSDPYLRKWEKPDDGNPAIIPDKNVNASAFRDPTTGWFVDGMWRVLVGSRNYETGVAYLYKSKDFKKWTRAKEPLHSVKNTGMWECPDFFPVTTSGQNGLDTSVIGKNVKHVFKVSLDLTRYDYYTVGTYDKQKDKYIPDKGLVDGWGGLRFDYGNFYASKTFFDPSKNRRILWGWANESDTPSDDKEKGWAGIQADVEVTFTFSSLDKAEKFDPKWANIPAQDVCAQKGSKGEGGLGPFGLLTLASEKLEEFTPVFFRVFKAENKHKVLLCSDARSSSKGKKLYMPSFAGFVDVDLADKKLSLRSLIDHSVVESFGAGGKTVITSRVYPTIAIDNKAHLFVFNNGTQSIIVEKLSAWSMSKPTMNPPLMN
ncbi:hypothetical protein JCGZ_06781 [Jatropha curcas]|uniref:Glycosyl hydrolase family 32 N-terminal domain-containing protein n=1 Tax=Jatropha curcas TaxID=180498 RepID=A0A067KMJ0_JATCU|nr:hypothetical protein JCGZ_06781 [Jatropha curcas]